MKRKRQERGGNEKSKKRKLNHIEVPPSCNVNLELSLSNKKDVCQILRVLVAGSTEDRKIYQSEVEKQIVSKPGFPGKLIIPNLVEQSFSRVLEQFKELEDSAGEELDICREDRGGDCCFDCKCHYEKAKYSYDNDDYDCECCSIKVCEVNPKKFFSACNEVLDFNKEESFIKLSNFFVDNLMNLLDIDMEDNHKETEGYGVTYGEADLFTKDDIRIQILEFTKTILEKFRDSIISKSSASSKIKKILEILKNHVREFLGEDDYEDKKIKEIGEEICGMNL